ncbi:hypothetical protein ACNOYE_00690 [Nannocystaceae bacterium ST9]
MGELPDQALPPARWRYVDDYMILFTEPNVPIPDELWDQVLLAIDGEGLRGVLSATGGDGFAKISKKQWRMSASITRQRGYPVAAVTQHRITLAMTRAANWLGGNNVAFKWVHLDDALEHLKVEPERRFAFREVLQELRAGIPPLSGKEDWPKGWGPDGPIRAEAHG